MSRLKEVRKVVEKKLNKMNDLSKPVKEKEQARYEKLCEEFGLG